MKILGIFAMLLGAAFGFLHIVDTIYFDAEYRELGMRMGLPTMLIKVDTTTDMSLWNVFFDSSFNDAVGNLQVGQRVSIFCRIKEMSGLVSQCDLLTMIIN